MAELFHKTNLERRSLIKGSLIGLASLPFISKRTIARDQETSITILHTNDVHSQLDAFPLNHPKYPGLGGAEARALLISEYRTMDPDLLLLDAGDMFQGTPYFNFFGGEPEIKVMNYMKYDASTLGNHEFDNGVAKLEQVLRMSKFPILNCNYGFENTALDGKIDPYKIFYRKGIKIGVFGIGVNLKGLVHPKLTKDIDYYDPLIASNRTATLLKHQKKCELVICLSHIGFQYQTNQVSDLLLAKKSENIDIIIGGHTHTFMDEPVFETNSVGQKVMISQVGWAGIRLGKISVKFQILQKEKTQISGEVIEIKKSREN